VCFLCFKFAVDESFTKKKITRRCVMKEREKRGCVLLMNARRSDICGV